MREMSRLTMVAALLLGGCPGEGSRSAATPERAGGEPAQAQARISAAPQTSAPDANAPYWPRLHGPKGNNISAETGLLKNWPKAGPTLLWTAKGIGEGFSSVTLGHGLIYTAGNVGGKTMVTALGLDGQIKWQTDNGPAWTGDYPGTRGTPTIDGGCVYHESPLGEVACFRAKTGEKLWRVNILQQFGGKNIPWALAESVLVDGDRVICCPGGKKGSVVALDKKTGRTVWAARDTGDLAGYASPTLVEIQGRRIILTMTAKAFVGVDADRGELLWRFEHITDYDVNALKPICEGDQVFICSGYGSGAVLLRIKVDGRKASVEEVWRSKDLDNHHGGVILLDGHLYGSAHQANSAKWICLEWLTGRRMYAERGVGKGSLTCADGMLYTMSENGRVGLVAASPRGHQVISEFRLPKGGEGPTWAHPVVCGRRLYLRHGDRLYAYGVGAGDESK